MNGRTLNGTGKQRARVAKAERRLMRAVKVEAMARTYQEQDLARQEGHFAALAVVNMRRAMQ